MIIEFQTFFIRFEMRKTIVFVMLSAIACAFFGIRLIRPIPETVAFQRYSYTNGVNTSDDVMFCPNVNSAKTNCIIDLVHNQQSVDDRMQCQVIAYA